MKRLTIAGLLLTGALQAQAGAPVTTTEGQLKDGTHYRIDMPQRWNGAVLVGLDYAAAPPGKDAQALFADGYALAGTTRAVSGWAIHRAAANAIETLDLLEARYGKAALPIQFGYSQGGHTAAVSLQAYPARWRGAIIACGGPSGTVGQWQGKFDGLFVARALLAPGAPLPVTGIPEDWRTSLLPAWQAVFDKAAGTPAGRARMALAARIAQLPEWPDPARPAPGPEDLEGRAAGLADSLGKHLLRQALGSRQQIERLSGGNITGNVGVDYAALLGAADSDGLVARLYRQAGLDLDSDLAMLSRAPRIEADPAALAWVATGVFDGDLRVPVLTLTGIGDAISPAAAQAAYQAVVEQAGKGALLRQVYTRSAGHCGFTPAETVASVRALATRIRSGAWPDTSPEGMTALARATGLGESRFIAFNPPPFLRPYDACTLLDTLERARVKPFALPGQALPRCLRAAAP